MLDPVTALPHVEQVCAGTTSHERRRTADLAERLLTEAPLRAVGPGPR